MTTITHHQLINSAAVRTRDGGYLAIPAPDGRPLEWAPAVAVAVAGHMAQHYPWTTTNRSMTQPIEVESTLHGAGSVILRVPGNDRHPTTRLIAGTSADTRMPYVRELCGHEAPTRSGVRPGNGHPGCLKSAPAGPGSRCPDHTTDPVPQGCPSTYWGEVAAAAWADAYNPLDDGPSGQRTNERNGMIRGALAAGVSKHRLHQITRIARTTIDRVINPPVSDDGDGDDDAA